MTCLQRTAYNCRKVNERFAGWQMRMEKLLTKFSIIYTTILNWKFR